jgi:hypothetical protein
MQTISGSRAKSRCRCLRRSPFLVTISLRVDEAVPADEEVGMSIEKFFAIITCIKEAKSIASALSLPPDSIPDTQKLQLLGLLDRAQQLIVSLRADYIDSTYFKPLSDEMNLASAGRAEPAEGNAEAPASQTGAMVYPLEERRRAREDRRKVQMVIQHDRRRGASDRRS